MVFIECEQDPINTLATSRETAAQKQCAEHTIAGRTWDKPKRQ